MQRAFLVFTCWALQGDSYQGRSNLMSLDNAPPAGSKQLRSDRRLLALLLAAFKPAAGWHTGLQLAGSPQHSLRFTSSVRASEERVRPLMQAATISPAITNPVFAVTKLEDADHYRAKVDEAIQENKVMVVEFHALYCRKCRAVNKKYEKFATLWPDVEFCKLAFDSRNSTRKLFNSKEIRFLPSFEVVGGSQGVVEVFKAGSTWISKLEGIFNGLL